MDPQGEHVSHPLIRPEAIKRREYQTVIAARALERSTLVVLPTGLGKTIVALMVAADRLGKSGSPVLMLAPTKPLVEQHRGFMEKILVGPKVVMLTGENPPRTRKEVYLEGDMVVTTPQVVKNDLISGDLDLGRFKTIIFDEAHRAVGDYPYCFISEMFYEKNPEGLVLGLTASPGHDANRIYEVCRNLGIENIEVRVDSDPDVRPYIQEMEVQTVKVEVSPGMRSVIGMLERMFLDRVVKLQRIGVVRKGAVTSVKELLGAAGRIQEMIQRAGKEGGAYYQAMSLQAQAMKVSHALELAETQGADALFQYLDRLLKETGSPDVSKATRAVVSDPMFRLVLNKVEALKGEEHPKVEALVRYVRQKLREDPSARIIAFTHFRDTASIVHERLSEFSGIGIKPVRFVGQASRENDEGLSQKEQKHILEDFREGRFNVLIATSVGEEGLDIPGADLVIFYEPIPSEIRTIQRRGRTGRHSAGKVVVLVSRETRDVAYSFSARDKEVKMERQLLSLRRMLSKMPLPERKRTFKPITAPAGPSPTLESFSAESDHPETGSAEIIVDLREMASSVVEELVRAGFTVRPGPLGEGDYLLSNRVAVERKTTKDMVDSLIDGRLFDQVKRLRDSYDRPVLLIEGDDLLDGRNVSRNALYGALSSILVDFNVPTVSTRDPAETAGLLAVMAKREQAEGRRPRQAPGAKGKTLRDVQVRTMCGLSGISTVLAERLLDRFGSLQAIFTASVEELTEVEGIGKAKAKELWSSFNERGS